jgi:hypothetical protein
MFKHVNENDSHLYNVINLDTNERILGVQWANDETGDYEVCLFNDDGSVKFCICNVCGDCHLLIEKKKGNIKLIKKEE